MQVGELTRLGGVTRRSIRSLILISSRLHDRWGDRPHVHVTSPIRGPPPPCKQALKRWFRVNETPLKPRTNQVFYRLKIRPVPCELA